MRFKRCLQIAGTWPLHANMECAQHPIGEAVSSLNRYIALGFGIRRRVDINIGIGLNACAHRRIGIDKDAAVHRGYGQGGVRGLGPPVEGFVQDRVPFQQQVGEPAQGQHAVEL